MTNKLLYFQILILTICLTGCRPGTKKILYINSYHEGYGSSDDITSGIRNVFANQNIEWEVVYMDTKRLPSKDHVDSVTLEILKKIEQDAPDLIIASDDNAVKHVVSQHLTQSPIPVVFCGVNWTAEAYQLPREHITGMLEVLPFKEGVELIRKLKPQTNKVYVLSEDSPSEEKNIQYITKISRGLPVELTYFLASDFEQWKNGFLQGNDSADLIYMPTNGAIRNWDEEAAIRFIREHIRVPVLTCDDFMMPYAVLGLTKVQSEQGEWAATAAIQILSGTSPSEIPVTMNRKTMHWINPILAERIGIDPGGEFLKNAKIYTYK